jgi:hypothetical protein
VRLASVPVDPLASHIAAMMRSLDDEVHRLRDEATAEAARAKDEARTTAGRLVDDARAKAHRILEQANHEVAEAEARRDAMLEERATVIAELLRIRDTIVGLAGRFDQERPDLIGSSKPGLKGGAIPPPPRSRRVDENQQELFSAAADANDAAETSD